VPAANQVLRHRFNRICDGGMANPFPHPKPLQDKPAIINSARSLAFARMTAVRSKKM
jgi:hypothetical protein